MTTVPGKLITLDLVLTVWSFQVKVNGTVEIADVRVNLNAT